MRKSLLLLATALPLAGLVGLATFALPAAAESDHDGSCITQAAVDVGPLDLNAIPQQPVTGPLSVRGVGDCDDDDGDDDSISGGERRGDHESHNDDDDEGHGDNDD
jgi:hypothetical protein